MVQQLVGSSSLGLGKLIDGKNQFIHIRYSANADGSNMTIEIQPDTKYIGIRTSSSETPSVNPADYSWGRFVGASGSSSYTWIRYSANEDGSNMTTIANEDTKYIGVAITDEDSAPTDHTRYSWALFKGSDGRGVERTEVSYQKSTSGTVIPTGAWSASIPSVNDGEYLWTRTLFFYTDGTTTSTFAVSRNGVAGLGIANTDVHYQKSTNGTTAPTGTWTITIPHVMPNEYLWTRTTITYTDGSSTVSYSVGKMGADGRDAQLLYLTASSQVQAFDENDEPKTTEAIIISAKLQNASGAATFVAIPYIGNTAQPTITLGGTGNDRTLLPSQWASTEWTSIAITATLGPLTDTISVVKVKDGRTPVVHTAWADSEDGRVGFTLEKPVGKIPKYKGHYVDYSLEASTDPTKYKWERNPDDAGNVADGANDKSDLANQLANAAKELADKAKADAAEANRLLGLANEEIGRLNTDVSNAKSELERAEAELNSQIETVETKLTQDYATKTSLSETEITLNRKLSESVASVKQEMSETYAVKTDLTNLSGDYASFKEDTAKKFSQQVSSIEIIQTDTETAKKLVDDALSKAQSAITNATNANNLANSALDKASGVADIANSASQTAADAIASANNAIGEANAAKNNADKAIADVAALTKTVTAQGTKIDQTSSRIDLVANSITEVGNRLDNSTEGINLFAVANSIKGYRVVDGSSIGRYPCYSDINHTISELIPCSPGDVFTVSTTQTTDDARYITIGFFDETKYCFNRPNGYISGVTADKPIAFTAPKGSKYVAVSCENTLVGKVKLERGKTATTFTKAIADQQADIDSTNSNLQNNYYSKTEADAAIKVAADSVTTTVRKEVTTEITNVNNKVDDLKLIGENLMLNGYGEFGNNKNFNNYIFDGTNSYNNRPSFKTSLKTTLSIGNSKIPIDINKAYEFSMNIKSDNNGKIFLGWYEYDIDGERIYRYNTVAFSKSTTILSKDLNDGDTVVYLESTANWSASDLTYQNGLIFWNYRDSTGYLYPEGVYSRNVWFDLYTKENVNKTNNTITLKSPWNHGTITAGTKVSQSNDGGTYKYRNFTNTAVPTSWTNTSFRIGEDHQLQAPYNYDETKFSPAAKSIAFVAMWSYGTSVVDTYYINSIELKDIDSKLSIDGINNNLSNNYYQKTVVDSKLSTTADGITAQYTKDINTKLDNYYDKSTIDSKLTIDGQGITTYVKNTQSQLDNLQVGGRNYLVGTNKDYKAFNLGQWSAILFSRDLSDLNLKVGDYITVSCDLKVPSNAIKGGRIRIQFFNTDADRPNYYGSICNIGEEKRLTRTVQIDSNLLRYKRVDLIIESTNTNITTVESGIQSRHEQLEIGNKATDWAPAPEDLQVGGRNYLSKSIIAGANFYKSNEKLCLDLSINKDSYAYFKSTIDLTTLVGKTITFSFDSNMATGRTFGIMDQSLGQITNIKAGRNNYTFIFPNSIRTNKYELLFDDAARPTETGILELSNFKLEIGNQATDWTPAPEDMATAEDAQNAQDAANSAQSTADDANSRVTVAESTIKQLSDSISMLVTDSNGSSMMTQTSDGWTFNIGAITSAIDNASNNINNLTNSMSQANNTINNLNNLANDLSKKTAYINMTTDDTGAPCIELGKTGNAFKVRITNTSVDFIQGSSKIAYVSNQALFIEKAIIKNELQIGESKGFVWKTRSNGNLGLRWFG